MNVTRGAFDLSGTRFFALREAWTPGSRRPSWRSSFQLVAHVAVEELAEGLSGVHGTGRVLGAEDRGRSIGRSTSSAEDGSTNEVAVTLGVDPRTRIRAT